jgi:dTDP-4-dehydrorhamnose 3,5-epimerase
MIFSETGVAGLIYIESKKNTDHRGAFTRLYCKEIFDSAGLVFQPVQISISENNLRGTLRGLHFQYTPFSEAKLVRCVSGSVFDVVVDLRNGPTFGQWRSFELSALEMNALYVPEGVAHGFLTLSDRSSVLYQMDRPHVPGRANGILWNDPQLKINWPFEPSVLSQMDMTWPRWSERNDLPTQ